MYSQYKTWSSEKEKLYSHPNMNTDYWFIFTFLYNWLGGQGTESEHIRKAQVSFALPGKQNIKSKLINQDTALHYLATE